MQKFVVRGLTCAISIAVVAHLLEGIRYDSISALLVASLLLGIVNAFVWPILFFITLPLNLITLGLFTFLLNGLLLYFIGAMVRGFTVDGLGTATLGAFIISILNFLLYRLLERSQRVEENFVGS